jgi:hypothetical protein
MASITKTNFENAGVMTPLSLGWFK